MKLRIELNDDNGALYVGEAELRRSVGKKARAKPEVPGKRDVRVTCGVALQHLWASGQFKQAMSLKQIAAALSKDGGCNFRTEALLMALSRAKFLTRRGAKGSYTWIQKYPHGG
jgi:hypothetical protein